MPRRKKKEKREEGSEPQLPPAVHVSVSGHSIEDVHNKLAAIHGRGAPRKPKRFSKRASYRE